MSLRTPILYILEFAFAHLLLRIFLSANHLPWRFTRVPVEEMAGGAFTLPQSQPAFVNPFTVEYLPNPVIFRTAVAMYAGYNAVRAAFRTHDDTTLDPEEKEGEGAVKIKCVECGTRFGTKGLLRRHTYRKHIRRFACEQCSGVAFHLKKDLERHKQSVHRSQGKNMAGFSCKNAQCATPDLVFARKDNFERHVRRCSARREKNVVSSLMTERKIVPAAVH